MAQRGWDGEGKRAGMDLAWMVLPAAAACVVWLPGPANGMAQRLHLRTPPGCAGAQEEHR